MDGQYVSPRGEMMDGRKERKTIKERTDDGSCARRNDTSMNTQ